MWRVKFMDCLIKKIVLPLIFLRSYLFFQTSFLVDAILNTKMIVRIMCSCKHLKGFKLESTNQHPNPTNISFCLEYKIVISDLGEFHLKRVLRYFRKTRFIKIILRD